MVSWEAALEYGVYALNQGGKRGYLYTKKPSRISSLVQIRLIYLHSTLAKRLTEIHIHAA